MVNMRLAMTAKRPKPSFPRLAESGGAVASHRREVYLRDMRKPLPCPVYPRSELGPDCRIAGPALIQEHGTTTVMFEDDICTVAPSGELIITVARA
jgi:N-methylhydantoinase A